MRIVSPVALIAGTRPEVIKFLPLLREFRARGMAASLIMTGQHPDLAKDMLAEAGLQPDIDLGLSGYSASTLPGAVLTSLSPILHGLKPGMVLVQGDTASALGGALAAGFADVPVGHVEAGLRTGNRAEPFPEEMIRCSITPLAELHFAPTVRAAAALRREGVADSAIHVTGNTGIDCLFETIHQLDHDASLSADLCDRFSFLPAGGRRLFLATVHRRENIGPRLEQIAIALRQLALLDEAEIVIPLHPNPAVADVLKRHLQGLRCVHLLASVEHAAMVWLMRRADLLLTDSGGLQEEAPAFGLHTLILRRATERMEAVEAGLAELVPLTAEGIVDAARRAVRRPRASPAFPFGDGTAAAQIAHVVEAWVSGRLDQGSAQPIRALA